MSPTWVPMLSRIARSAEAAHVDVGLSVDLPGREKEGVEPAGGCAVEKIREARKVIVAASAQNADARAASRQRAREQCRCGRDRRIGADGNMTPAFEQT